MKDVIKEWESNPSELEEEKDKVIPPPKVSTIEEFYEMRKSKLNPVNHMLNKRRVYDKSAAFQFANRDKTINCK